MREEVLFSEYFNCAAMFPELIPKKLFPNYFNKVSYLQKSIINILQDCFDCPHTFYLLPNTTSGFLHSLLAVNILKYSVRSEKSFYPPYGISLRKLFPYRPSNGPHIKIITHLCPLTGHIRHLKKGEEKLLIVDAAQSLGSIFQNDVFSESDIFIAPLHKNLGIASGLGIVGINFSNLTSVQKNTLNTIFSVASQGCSNVELLEKCHQKIKHKRLLINNARIDITQNIIDICKDANVKLITPKGLQSHIISFKLPNEFAIEKLTAENKPYVKLFKSYRILRFSVHSAIHGDLMPLEYEKIISQKLCSMFK